MANDVLKMRYTNGLFLKQEEFNTEQNYHIRMRRLHNRHLHTWGIAAGLEVEIGTGTNVTIKEGMALNKTMVDGEEVSQEIVVPRDTIKDLSNFVRNDAVYVWLSYSDEKTDVVADKGGQEEIHWTEKAKIEAGKTPPADRSENILLAKVVLKDDGTIDANSIKYSEDNGTAIRTYAGIAGKSLETQKLTLCIEGQTSNLAFIEGKVINGLNGINVNSAETNLTGHLHVQGDLYVQGDKTRITTSEMEVEDNIVRVNKYTPQSTPQNINGGLEVFRGGTAPNAQVIWDEGMDRWKLGVEGTLQNILYGPNLSVDSGGNVGIGTTSPGSTLDVGGTSNSAFVQNLSAWGLNARAQGILIMPEGNVTDDGAGNLTIPSTIIMNPLSGSYIRVTAGTYALGGWGSLWAPIPPTGARGTTVIPTILAWADSDRNFDGRDRVLLAQRQSTGPIYTRFGVRANYVGTSGAYFLGNVGIGTTSPSNRLEVAGNTILKSPDSNIYSLQFVRNDENSRVHKWVLWHMNSSYRKNAFEIWEYKTDSAGKDCGGNAADGAMCSPRLTILEGGNVGIGSTGPTAKLEVNLSNSSGWSGNLKGMRLLSPDNNYYLDVNTYIVGSGNVGYQFSPNGNTGLVISTPGNVGIGTTSPQATLDVNGGIYAGNSDIYFTKTDHNHSGIGNTAGYAAIENAANYGALMILGRTTGTSAALNRVVKLWDYLEVNGTAAKTGGGSWAAISDLRLKKNIAPINNALDSLLQLRGIKFEWKEPQKHGNIDSMQTGFIAQEVEKVFPEWVGTDPDGYKYVGIKGFEALIVEAVRELFTKIKQLEAKI